VFTILERFRPFVTFLRQKIAMKRSGTFMVGKVHAVHDERSETFAKSHYRFKSERITDLRTSL